MTTVFPLTAVLDKMEYFNRIMSLSAPWVQHYAGFEQQISNTRENVKIKKELKILYSTCCISMVAGMTF